MHEVEDLVSKLTPSQTALLLGAGASIPSGGPSGNSLARQLGAIGDIANPEEYSLEEIAGLFEQRHGRARLAEAVYDILDPLEPAGGIQVLPEFDWYRIYSTNFDQLIEKVYYDAGSPITVRRSNIDFSRMAEPGATELYKIHGCITEDLGFGHLSRMLLTDDDYERFDDMRQASFRALASDILTKDFLIIGQSLADSHLKELVRDALRIRNEANTTGRIFVLTFNRDEGLARLQEARGAEVFFGDMDSLFGALIDEKPKLPEETAKDAPRASLPIELMTSTVDPAHAMRLAPNARSMFNGAPASYADIAAGLAFDREVFSEIVSGLRERPIAVILGAGGVGKTTLARQVVLNLGGEVDAAWEHTNSFVLRPDAWIQYERALGAEGKRARLFVDDCAENLSAVSRIADHLGSTPEPSLRLVLTATTGKWKQRAKSRFIFSHGAAFTLSLLSRGDIGALLTLTNSRTEIRELVEAKFLNLPRGQQDRILRDRCSADMFVCMKNIFATEKLDHILLREFADLEESARDVYRNVAALQSLGAKVHRQLIIRLLGIETGALLAILDSLTGVVSEFDIDVRGGYYGWETRHREIAKTIAQYKFANQEELDRLFVSLIDAINPTIRLEVDTARSLCTEEFGIDRLTDTLRQVELLRKVVKLLPGEQVPRHRLIRHLIDQDRLDEASAELRKAQQVLRPNPVLSRYEVLILSRSAEHAVGLLYEDRVAMLLDAHGRAVKMVQRYADDMHCYNTLADVALRLADRGGLLAPLEEAVEKLRDAEVRTLDPQVSETRARYEAELNRRLSGTAA
ncbi:SIR2 family protein [Microbacterium enclense]|uniref:SIR2 family protein n=1 Tax=Microbacterium enclense TaxID=993073 RepID=UPI0021A51633|nr:SIR2 family protein [Microbacterium enclense]MCT2084613.1 SIR2 family protein [Microbacterium enclense]